MGHVLTLSLRKCGQSVKATYSPEYLAGKYKKKKMNEMNSCILEMSSAVPGTWHIH